MLFSCGQSTQQKEATEKKDSLSPEASELYAKLENQKPIYSPQDTATVTIEREIVVDQESFKLRFVKHCLKDSAIAVKNNEQTFIASNYSERVILTKGNTVIFDKQIRKEDLKDKMEEHFYRRCFLYDTRYNFYRDDSLFFTSTFTSHENWWMTEVKFAIIYKGANVGVTTLIETDVPSQIVHHDVDIYDLQWLTEKKPNERVGFSSFSDKYSLYNVPEYSAIPEANSTKEYFVLPAQYRKRFLNDLEISESDKVFVYNYQRDTLATFIVKNLNVAAYLNVYSQGTAGSHGQSEFMYGFEIPAKYFKSLAGASLVTTGTESPFVQGQMKPIDWKKIDPTDFPPVEISTMMSFRMNQSSVTDTYRASAFDLEYFVQEYTNGAIRHLVILDSKTREIQADLFFQDMESTSPAPLNSIPNEYNYYMQWTGKLLKGKPIVVFGFDYVSFGCPSITVLSKPVSLIYINCDNRH